jgi:hypothetical protein
MALRLSDKIVMHSGVVAYTPHTDILYWLK